ncbi:MAG: hypothetical protein JXB26_03975 [Candidatus Aminicenantes bacterium]|nr:hypothetical protein [Candidatus Aminicenantes bacterium]
MKKYSVFLIVLLIIPSVCYSGLKNKRLSLFLGVNHVFEYGAEEDYVLGENDFPVTPAHTPPLIGASFSNGFGEYFGLEVESLFILGSRFTIEDPSDGDTVEVLSDSRLSLSLNVFFRKQWGQFCPYLIVGGGLDKLLAKEEKMTSAYGYEITFEVPERTFDPFVQFGGGVEYLLSDSMGMKLNVRYVLIFDELENVGGMNISLGFFFIL